MARTLLVSHVVGRAHRVRRLAARLAPVAHMALGDPRATVGIPHTETPAGVLSPEERRKVLEESRRWLKALPAAKAGRRPLAERLLYHDTSLWWWVESPLWFGDPRDASLPPLPTVFEELAAVRSVADASSADRIVFVPEVPSVRANAFRELAGSLGIPLEDPGADREPTARILDAIRPSAIRFALERRRASHRREPPRAEVLLVSHRFAVRPVRGHPVDVYLGPLREELSRRRHSVASVYVDTVSDANPLSRSPTAFLPGDGFLLEETIGPGPARATSPRVREILSAWKALETGGLFRWHDVDLEFTFRGWLDRLLRRHGPTAVYYLEAFDELIRTMRPDVAVITNETGYAGRAAVLACRRHGVRSLGVQHGVIDPGHVEYLHLPQHLDPNSPLACPIPDLTALDGTYYERVLKEDSAYPPDSTAVTGQMRYEAYASRRPEVTTRPREGILIATQPLPDRREWLGAVMEALRETAPIVVKVHPLEDVASVRSIVEGTGVTARVVRDADLDELLRASRALVARSSTTVVEAAIADCPAVVFNPAGPPDPVFVEAGGAVAARSPDDLRAVLKDVLEGGPNARRILENRTTFLRDFAYGGAAGAAARVADLAEGLLRAPVRAR